MCTNQKDENHYARERDEEESGERLIHVFEHLKVKVSHQYSERRQERIVHCGEFFYLKNKKRRQSIDVRTGQGVPGVSRHTQ